jgi:8-oxo-dGTP diphosphatase
MSQRREVSCCFLIDRNGKFLLQQRDDILNIVQPGKIGMFGGHREDGETFVECAIREIGEEVGLELEPPRLRPVMVYDGIDVDGLSGHLVAAIFVAVDILSETLVVTEGSLCAANESELPSIAEKLTPLTQMALRELLSIRGANSNLATSVLNLGHSGATDPGG